MSASRTGGEVRPPRVVMLVHNNVYPDSRVQKTARSMADRGWDVILLGQVAKGGSAGRGPRTRWRLGEARVRLLPRTTSLARRPHQVRDPRWRDPLAYRSAPVARYRQAEMGAGRRDLQTRRLQQQQTAEASWRTVVARADLAGRRAVFKARSRWVELRAKHTDKVRTDRMEMSSRLDRTTTSFWSRALGDRSWRHLDPHLWDYEFAFGPTVDRLRPDIIHANDWIMLGVAARAKLRARAAGRNVRVVWDAHEFLPGITPWSVHPRWHRAQVSYEREFAPQADAVVTVSEPLADLLVAEHRLTARPAVVMNCPTVATSAEDGPHLRAACGLDVGVPLLVYSGGAAPSRGLDTLVEALPTLPDVHCALVTSESAAAYVRTLTDRADALGVAERLHVVPYVPHHQVVSFLSSADIGVIPIRHSPNHEISLITKFFEYSHARLPIVMSDVKVMAETVRRTGQGEVFRAEDAADLTRAVNLVLADPERYRAAYGTPGLLDSWTWEGQAAILDDVYRQVLSDSPR